jgi:hypothetical protein
MVELYVKLIIAKRKTIDKIPTKFQEEVREKLLEFGYNEHGEKIEQGN